MRMRTLLSALLLLLIAASPLLAQPVPFNLPVSLCGANAYAQAHPGARLHIYVQSNPRFAPEYNFTVSNNAGTQNFVAANLDGYRYNWSTHTWYVVTYNVLLVDWNLLPPNDVVKQLYPRADITNYMNQSWHFRLSNTCPLPVYWKELTDEPPTNESWGALKGQYR